MNILHTFMYTYIFKQNKMTRTTHIYNFSYVYLLDECMLSCFNHVPTLFNPWTVALQVLLSMGFSRQAYWSGLPCLSPGDLPHLGEWTMSLTFPALAGGFFTTSPTWEVLSNFDRISSDYCYFKIAFDSTKIIPYEYTHLLVWRTSAKPAYNLYQIKGPSVRIRAWFSEN